MTVDLLLELKSFYIQKKLDQCIFELNKKFDIDGNVKRNKARYNFNNWISIVYYLPIGFYLHSIYSMNNNDPN